MTSKWECFSH